MGCVTLMSHNESVTVVVTRKVKQGRESDYEDWLRRLLEEAKYMKGYLGVKIQKPATGSTEYTSVFRFDTVENLRKFEESEIRARYLREVIDYVEADAIWKKFTGLEFWFAPPKGTVIPQPSRFRMATCTLNRSTCWYGCSGSSVTYQAFCDNFHRDFLDDLCSYASHYKAADKMDLSLFKNCSCKLVVP